MKRLIPPDDCPEEIARRLDVIQQHRALNAILGVNPDAMSQAEQHQQQRRRGEPIGPLHGVPLIVKDNIACAPMPITLGCRALASLNATADARVVQRLRRAGAIILARANMSSSRSMCAREARWGRCGESTLPDTHRRRFQRRMRRGGGGWNGGWRIGYRYRRLYPHSL